MQTARQIAYRKATLLTGADRDINVGRVVRSTILSERMPQLSGAACQASRSSWRKVVRAETEQLLRRGA